MSAAFGKNACSPGLDLVRASAIVWVTIYHAMTFDLVPEADRWTVGFGWMGVDLFFVLSGFLIGGQLLEPWASGERPHYERFLARRLLRTLPAYAVVVALYFAVPGVREREAIQPLWQFVTFTENLLIDLSTPRSFSHVWSLCVEEHFYLVFPAGIALLAVRPSMRTTTGLFAAVVLFGMTVRGALWLTQVAEAPFDARADADWRAYLSWIYYPTWSRLDGLVAGVAAATIRLFRPHWWRRLTTHGNRSMACGCVGIGLSIVMFQNQIAGFLPTVLGFPLLAASMALVVCAASEPTSFVGRRPIAGAGVLAASAYSVYLVQKIAFHLVAANVVPSFGSTGILRLVVALVVVGSLGASLHWLVERPFLRLRDRLWPSGPRAMARDRIDDVVSPPRPAKSRVRRPTI